jgi:UTP--glucose-1-phosphate uridylyltransferase
VLLGDDIMADDSSLLADMLRVHERYGRSVLAAMEVSRDDISLYGVIAPEFVEDRLARVTSIVEKPSPDEAPSNLAAIGRYVLTPEIFDRLRDLEPGKGGEIQLTDAINALAQDQAVYAWTCDDRARDRTRGHRRGPEGVPRRPGAAQEAPLADAHGLVGRLAA